MSATPRANYEYSRGSGSSDQDSGGNFGDSGPPSRRRTAEIDPGAGGLILGGSLLATLLLVVAEFTALYKVHLATSSVPIKTVSGGSNHSYAMLVVALAAATMGIAVWRSGSRPALLGLGLLGLVALLIAVLGDLPDSQASGLAGSAARGYVNATSTPSAGLYLETLGAIILIATSGLGFMMLGAPRRRRQPRPGGPSDPGRGRPGGSEAGRPLGNGGLGNGGAGDGRPGQGRPETGGLWTRPKRGESGPEEDG